MPYKKDFFRDTKIRYLGYANEVGESLRPVIEKKFVHYSYGIAFGYVLGDIIDKAITKLWKDGRPHKMLWATGDAFLWQSFASIIIPGLAINRIVHYSEIGLMRYAPKLTSTNRAWAAVAIGLCSIPIIVTPIDLFVHMAMTLSYRLLFK